MDKKAYSIAEFCEIYGLSRSGFYKLRCLGDGPQIFKVGTHVLISLRAAQAWVQRMETEKCRVPRLGFGVCKKRDCRAWRAGPRQPLSKR